MNTNSETLFRETAQRQKILEILCSTKSHPTADWIYERAKKEFPKLSLGTVYRNLKILKKQGRLRELPFGDTFDRFDADTSPHAHFVCRRCNAVYDLEIKQPRNLARKAAIGSGFNIDGCTITFYGACKKCK